MIRNYFRIAWRNIVKNKTYSAINITGLAVGMAVSILILLWINDELSFDRFHRNTNRIYKVNSQMSSISGEQVWDVVPPGLKPLARQAAPEIEDAVRFRKRNEKLLFGNSEHKFTETNTAYVDSAFFSVFDFQPIMGNSKHPFSENQAVVLTEALAKKYFGDANPIGKSLLIDKDNYFVSSVIPNFPENSTIRYDALFPMGQMEKWLFEGGNGEWPTLDEELNDFGFETYFLLGNNASSEVVGKKISAAYSKRNPSQSYVFTLQPLASLHLKGVNGNSSGLQTVRIFLMLGILILVIASINYVNLSTARSIVRSREVSTRKIIGAQRMQLFLQFVTESVVLFILASFLAFVLVLLLLPLYNTVSGKQLNIGMSNSSVWLVILSVIVGTLLLSAIYPAVLLSSFKPLDVLKRKSQPGLGAAWLRKALVVFQFVFSVGLIVATIVVGKQLKYIREKNLGYDKEYVFSFTMRDEMRDHYEAVRNELLKQTGILGVASSFGSIVNAQQETAWNDWEGKPQNSTFIMNVNGADKDLIPLLEMRIVAGRNFSGSRADSAHFILNETAIKQAGIKDPIGKKFAVLDLRGTIIGIVKDFHTSSLKEKIKPGLFYYGYPGNYAVYNKTTGRDAAKAVAAAEKVWKKYSPGYPFEYHFLDDAVNDLYFSDQRTGQLFNVFAAVAIFISCLGLFGLAAYTAERRTKEIGIRKVLGATISNVIALLSKDFLRLVAIASIVAFPLAWWMMNKFLQGYAYRINIQWWVFAVAGLLAVGIALFTVSFQAIKAAIANPVKSLRTE